jgi:Ca2+-binding EF-hand superfamily protein
VLNTFDGIWKTLCAAVDTNKDGRISRDEFQSGIDNTFISGTKNDSVCHPASQAILNLCDTDDDGTLSSDEFMKLQEAMVTTPDGGRAAFKALDRDNSLVQRCRIISQGTGVRGYAQLHPGHRPR